MTSLKLTQQYFYKSKILYFFAFAVFALLLAIRESESYGHAYDFLPVVGRTIPFFLLSLFLLVIYRFQGGSNQSIGLSFPNDSDSIRTAFLWIFKWALLILIARIGSAFITQPILQLLPEQNILERANPLVGNLTLTILLLPLMWLAVIGEEVLFRGLLLKYITMKLGEDSRGWVLAVVISAIIFGALHFWKGPAGMISSAIGGLVFGFGYLLTNRNLWPCIIAHCAGNTLGFISSYLSN